MTKNIITKFYKTGKVRIELDYFDASLVSAVLLELLFHTDDKDQIIGVICLGVDDVEDVRAEFKRLAEIFEAQVPEAVLRVHPQIMEQIQEGE